MSASLTSRAVLLAAFLAASAACGAADISQRMMCATLEALDCEAGTACFRGRPSELGAPAFMRIDLETMTIAGSQRTTPIVSMEKRGASMLLQGAEGAYAWTLAVGTGDGSMTATLVNEEGAFVLFGSCTAL
jgi:hypothetical protein